MVEWNPWSGCHPISEGCRHCPALEREENSPTVRQTKDFYLPIKRSRANGYRLTFLDNPVYVCTDSDFFLEEADRWRPAAWDVMHHRSDLQFKIITRRIQRVQDCMPKNRVSIYDNVTVVCACENQSTVEERLPILSEIRAAHKEIWLEPLLEDISVEPYLADSGIEAVTCGGETGNGARLCDYDWILHIREQCLRHQVAFRFRKTGTLFRKDGRIYHLDRSLTTKQAQKADIDYTPPTEEKESPYENVWKMLSQKYHRSIVLPPDMRRYCQREGWDKLRRQAYEIVRKNLSPAYIRDDSSQPPLKEHPVYFAQYAVAAVNRKMLWDWHEIPEGRKLKETEIIYIVELIMEWLKREMEGKNPPFYETLQGNIITW